VKASVTIGYNGMKIMILSGIALLVSVVTSVTKDKH